MFVSKNREIKKRNNSAIETIRLFILKIIEDYNIKLQYHDIIGVFLYDSELSPVLMEYHSHVNDFCSYVKCNKKCGFDCYLLKSRISQRLRRVQRPIYGRCHMGMEEYVFPVCATGKVIGYFTAGEFYSDREKSSEYLKEKAEQWGFDEEKLKRLFFDTARMIDFDNERFMTDMNTLAYLVGLYIKNSISDKELEKQALSEQGNNSKNYVVEMAKEYIASNFTGDISLETIAGICHCNSSYLSSIFKKKTGKSVSEYLNEIRINRARLLLWVSPKSVTQISYDVGYNDSGYFSRVFKKLTGMSPEVYRKRMNKQK